MTSQSSTSMQWHAPELVRLGGFRDLTQQTGCNKTFGTTDGFTFEGQAIVCRS
jgi:hypothetical protein